MQIRFKVALDLAKKSVASLITFATNVVNKCSGNAFLPVPIVPLASITTAINELVTAAAAAIDGGKLQVTIQQVKRIALENLLTATGQYVEFVANDPANAVPLEQPVEIIESAGMKVKRVHIPSPRVFGAKAGELPGTVKLVAARAKNGTHEWEYSLNPLDPDSWTGTAPTTKASTTINGLNSVVTYYFRHRAVLKTGLTAWDEPVSAVIL